MRSGYFEPLNLWIAPGLTPGNRKSSVQRAAAGPLLAWEAEQARELEPEIKRVSSEVATLGERVKRLRAEAAKGDMAAAREAAELEADMPEIPRPPQLWTSDATSERLGAMLAGSRAGGLSHAKLICKDGELVLRLRKSAAALMGEVVEKRLSALAGALNCSASLRIE